jgi:putative spermidine/putrescine transport system ATP-binding protein
MIEPAKAHADLQLDGIAKRFGAVVAVHPLTLSVAAGTLIAVLGPSGCGKTTTLRMIAGFEAPDEGRIAIGGRDVTHLPPEKRGLGMVFQNYSLFPHRTVAENIAFGLRMHGVSRAERDRRVADMLSVVRLPDLADRYPAQLSGGQQQRVALARAMVVRPRVLLLDEPLGALDKNLRESMQFELRSLQQRLGVTTLLVTHDQEEALSMSDEVAVMSHGRVLQVGPPAEIYDRPATRFVSTFLGTSNILTGRAGEGAAMLTGADAAIRVLLPSRPGHGDVVLSVRPERVLLGAAAEATTNRFAATVRSAAFRGAYAAYELHVEALNRIFYAYRHPQSALGCVDHEIGERVTLGWHAEDGVIVEEDA